MNNKYEFVYVMNDRWAIWYKHFNKSYKARIGVYKIVDLYSGTRKCRFAFRYKPRQGQTQDQSDALIIMNCINNFTKTPYLNPRVKSRGGRRSSFAYEG